MLKISLEEGICTEDVECNLRGDIEMLSNSFWKTRNTSPCLIQVHRKSM